MPAPTIDLSALNDLFEGDRSRMKEWVDIYLEEAPPLFMELSTCQQGGDVPGLVSIAHDLKPLAYYLGVPQVFELLTEIAQRARAEGAPACGELVQELVAFSMIAETELRAFAAEP